MKANNIYLPIVFLLVIFAAIYFMYGDAFSTKQVDLGKYLELCEQYRKAEKAKFTTDEIRMLVSEVNYLVPGELKEISDAQQRSLKMCAAELASRIEENK